MDEKELERLYKAMSQQFDIGDYNTFKTKMQTTDDRKRFYDAVSNEGFDVGDYNEYEGRLAGLKKKETSSNASKLGSLIGGAVGKSKAPSASNEPTIFDKPFLDRDIERGFDNSLSNPDLHKPKDGSILRNDYYQKRKAEHETKKQTATYQVKSSPQALAEYNQKRHKEIDEESFLIEQKKEQYRDHSSQESTGTFAITDPKKYKELEDEQARLQQYKDELKSNVAYEAANQIIPKYLESPIDFNPQEIGKEILRIADPQAASEIDMVEQAGNVLPGIKKAELNRYGLEIGKEALQKHQDHPNYPSLIQNVEKQLQDFDETNYELTGNRIREKVGNVLRSEGKQAWLGFGYDAETLKEAFQKTNPTPAEQKVFESYVLPLEQKIIGTNIPTGGFTKSLVNAMEKGAIGTVNTIGSFTGNRSDADRQVELMSDSEQKYRPAKDRTRWQKIVDGTGDLTGQVLNMALVSKGIGGIGKAFANPNVNLFLTSYLNSYDSYRKNALQVMPNASEAERNVYANFMAGVEGLTEKIFNDQKILKAFSKEVSPSVADITKRFVSKEITKDVAQNQLANSLKTFGKEFLKSSGQNAVEEASVGVFDDVAQSILGDKEFDVIATGKKAIETGFTTILHGGLVSGLAARGAQRSDKAQRAFQKATIVDMAKNPAPYLQSIEDLTFKGEITPEQAQEKTAIIKAAGEALQNLPPDAKQLDAPEIANYIIHKLNGDERSEGIAEGILMGTVEVNDDLEETSPDRNIAKALDVKYVPQEDVPRETSSSIEEVESVAPISVEENGDEVSEFVEKNKDEILKAWTKHYGDSDVAEDELEGYISDVRRLNKEGGKVYRVLFTNDISDIDKDSLGKSDSWTTSKENAQAIVEVNHKFYGEGKEKAFLIEADVKPDNVTIKDVDVKGNPHEKELGIKDANNLSIANIYQSVGKRFEQLTNQPKQNTESIVGDVVELEDFKNNIIEAVGTVTDSSFDWRIDLPGLRQEDREGAIADIKAGKNTKRRERFEAAIQDMYDKGVVSVNRGRGAHVEAVDIPIKDWFGLEQNEKEAAENLTDDVVKIINEEGITLESLETFKHIFDGFPYTSDDYAAVQQYLTRQAQGNAENQAANIDSQSEAQEITPTTTTNEQPITGSSIREQAEPTADNGDVKTKDTRAATEDTTRMRIDKDSSGEGTGEAAGGGDGVGIRNVDTAETRKQVGLPEYEKRTPKKDEELEAEADAIIKKGYDPEPLLQKLEKGIPPNELETVILKKYKATIEAEFEKNPNDENLAKIERLVKASDMIGSIQGAAFRQRQGMEFKDDSLAAYFVRDKEENLGAPLTETQKETVIKEHEAITELQKKLDEKIAELEAERKKNKAQENIKKAKSEKKSTQTDFKKERQEIKDKIKEKWAKAANDGTLTAVPLPYAKQLYAIAPEVGKLMRSYAEEGILKLDEMVKTIHSDLKEFIEDITEKDVRDLIAGEYNEKKPTQNELAAQVRDLREEQRLINKLYALLAGQEPKAERQKVQRNQQIENLRKQIRSLQKEKGVPESEKVKQIKTRLQKEIDKIDKQLKTGDFSTPEKKEIKLDAEGQNLKDQLIAKKKEREIRLLTQRYQNRTWKEKAFDEVAKVLNIPRTLMASMDFSAILRQGLLPTLSGAIFHNKSVREALRLTKDATLSGTKFDRWFYDLKEDKQYEEMKDDGLAISDPHSPILSAKEEAFMDGWVEKIPFIGTPVKVGEGKQLGGLVKASERAYSMYLNKLRVDIYKRMTAAMAKRGMTRDKDKEAYEQVAKYINISTGRGDIGSLEKYAPILNSLFFSPRLISSRLNMLTYAAQPRFWAKAPREVKIEYAKDIGATLAIGLIVLALAKAGGADVEDDPRSSDFGKIQSGNTRWDIWGGMQQYVRVVSQIFSGQTKSSTTDRIKELDGQGKYGRTWLDVSKGFVRGKLAPVPSLSLDLFSGETSLGDKVVYEWNSDEPRTKDLKTMAAEHLLPLTATGTYETIKDVGAAKGVMLGLIPGALGIGVQSYTPMQPEITAVVDGKERTLNKEEAEKYTKKRYEIFDKEISDWKTKGKYVEKNGKTVLLKWDKMDKEEQAEKELQAYSKAAREAKEILFGEQRDDEKEEAQREAKEKNQELYPDEEN